MLLQVEPFKMGSEKDAALKPLEEAAEVYGAWQGYITTPFYKDGNLLVGRDWYVDLADEIADCIQACVNIAARYKIDLSEAMRRCEDRNRRRGRYDGDGE